MENGYKIPATIAHLRWVTDVAKQPKNWIEDPKPKRRRTKQSAPSSPDAFANTTRSTPYAALSKTGNLSKRKLDRIIT